MPQSTLTSRVGCKYKRRMGLPTFIQTLDCKHCPHSVAVHYHDNCGLCDQCSCVAMGWPDKNGKFGVGLDGTPVGCGSPWCATCPRRDERPYVWSNGVEWVIARDATHLEAIYKLQTGEDISEVNGKFPWEPLSPYAELSIPDSEGVLRFYTAMEWVECEPAGLLGSTIE